ncbi:glycoside hydrolase family 3 N-terminal domain-containing protein [Paenibacillus arenilitoris]|uniref:Glycoside hydrolase family 3 C-terminal domain-containing protein n=1 Tax=Paenibacillus arenilitoris TaxID=2772299 RepID=A0A927CVZ5_9BACL|nr:glycoside hydrolase family 3 N-terminal domain-containing protein [Paenibacillus arenilitoris]MBD2872846.1 glycoside hydrolase family 3 C-terminal domain-containing protein [Paenibacillus arenilitoris]
MMLYKDRTAPVEQRVEDLLGRMTLKEKVGQLNQRMYGWDAHRKTTGGFELTDAFREEVAFGDGMGALYGLFRADPWSKMTFENGITAADSARVANQVQKYVIENTRLGIPVLLSEECPHGHQALDGTLTPTNIGIGSTWNPELAEEVYAQVAAELRSRGAHLGLVSTLDLARDPRWGRTEECFGEDPYLAERFTTAAVRGLQGEAGPGTLGTDKVGAVLKHLCGQGAGEGGLNAYPALIGEREMREIHLPAMKAGTEAGALGCMAAYNEIDGIPCHANDKLLTGILREEWGFEGIVMADGTAVDRLLTLTGDHESAASLALTAGVDLSLWDKAFGTLEQAVLQGKVDEAYVDRAVRRILHLKFKLGLFENPYTDTEAAGKAIGSDKTKDLILQQARECVVLLKNEQGILPLRGDAGKRIAVIGPNADAIYNQLGDYTSNQREGAGTTVLQGIREAAGLSEVAYAKGCSVRGDSREGFAEAVEIAKQSDVAVLVMGGSSARHFDIQFDINGAAIVADGKPDEMDCGEGVDLSDLRLGGVQPELIREIAATGTPIVLVLIQGRPHTISDTIDLCQAALTAWYPGPEGGRAIGEILFGTVNPSGKLAVTIPTSSMTLPVYYNKKELGYVRKYADSGAISLYPFGYGLSYTTFEYSNLRVSSPEVAIEELEAGGHFEVAVDLKNTGEAVGAEVAQLYIKDMEASVTPRVKELKGFRKVWLEPGERREIVFRLTWEELSLWNRDMKRVVEPGRVKLMAGGDSNADCEAMVRLLERG